jgi:hypothetical protein
VEGCSPPSSIKFTTIYNLYFNIPPLLLLSDSVLPPPPDRRMWLKRGSTHSGVEFLFKIRTLTKGTWLGVPVCMAELIFTALSIR